MNASSFFRRDLLRLGSNAIATLLVQKVSGHKNSFANAGPASGDVRAYELQFPSMGSTINLRWVAESSISPEKLRALAHSVASDWVAILSDYEPDSEASQVCEQADRGDWTRVSGSLWNVLAQCDHWNRQSDGAFDAGLGAITRLRRVKRRSESEEAWEQARKCSGWDRIGKGIVVDAIAEKLVEVGIECFNVNASGNMRLGKGPKLDGWPIAIDYPVPMSLKRPEPNDKNTASFAKIRLSECGIATSGDRWQRFPDAPQEASSLLSSHILEPRDKRGVGSHHSVTVIAPTGTLADIVATTTSVHFGRDPIAWLKKLTTLEPNIEVLILNQNHESGDLEVTCNALASKRSQGWQTGATVQIAH
jgi:FAD:protein FMN transferase